MSIRQRLQDRRLLKTVEEGKRAGYPVDEIAQAIPEIGDRIAQARAREAARQAKKKR